MGGDRRFSSETGTRALEERIKGREPRHSQTSCSDFENDKRREERCHMPFILRKVRDHPVVLLYSPPPTKGHGIPGHQEQKGMENLGNGPRKPCPPHSQNKKQKDTGKGPLSEEGED